MLKAVIFDMGGVLIRTQNRAGREKWAARLGMEAGPFENLIFNGESGHQAQLGQKTAKAHWDWVGDHFGLSHSELAELRRDFFSGDVLDEVLLAYIGRLRQAGYRLGLLSNAADEVRQTLTEKYPILTNFDGVVISAEVGLMKPDPKIYHLAVESVGVQANEAVFVDDFIENIEGARQVGLQAIHFVDAEKVQQELVAITGVA